MGIINRIKQDHPIFVDKYLMGKEIEVDAVCDAMKIFLFLDYGNTLKELVFILR